MGTIFKRHKKWGINYIDSNGNQVRKIVSPYKETASRILKKIETDIAEGKYMDIKKKKDILFENFAEEYINTYVKLENKNVGKQRNLINGLVRHFKGEYLSKINTLMVRQYMSKRLESVRPASVNKDYAMLKSMFNRAIEWSMLLGTNPVSTIKKLPENNERTRWLTENEQERLLLNCKGMTKIIVLVALKTGLRWGEITSLKWDQSSNSNYVDFDSKTILVHESLAKSKKSRHIPLCSSVVTFLKTIPRQSDTDYIFWNPKKEKRMRSIRKSFDTALKKADIMDFKFHDLRHTFASQLVRNGVDLFVVQKLLGHSNPKMTQRYAHLQSDQLRDAIRKIDNRIDLQFQEIMYNTSLQDSTVLAQLPCEDKTENFDIL
ncbi:MAG: site-specific integrase [Candidatus Zapsychrus exili]|nr:site-specific integrase [Candidatus Zapsychrus exili]